MALREVCAEVEIKGSAKRVWRTLTNFPGYPIWNPFMRIAGQPRVGSRLHITLVRPGHRNLTLQPVVRAVEDNRELRWVETPRIPLIFEGERIITIERLDSRAVRVVQRERFKGLLAPLLRRLLANTKRLLEATNIALKARIERG